MVDWHGEKTTKHFDQCGSQDDKKILYILVALAKSLTQ